MSNSSEQPAVLKRRLKKSMALVPGFTLAMCGTTLLGIEGPQIEERRNNEYRTTVSQLVRNDGFETARATDRYKARIGELTVGRCSFDDVDIVFAHEGRLDSDITGYSMSGWTDVGSGSGSPEERIYFTNLAQLEVKLGLDCKL